MANYRATAKQVIEIMDTALTEAEIEPFLIAADAVIDGQLSGAGLTDALLTEICRWLAAHFIASGKEQAVKSESMGGASATYQGTTGEGLKGTKYGQQVQLLDSSGILAQVGMKPATVETLNFIDGGTSA